MGIGIRGLVVKHWRGEYSLARSFWLHYLLPPIVILFLILVGVAVVGTSSPYGSYLDTLCMLVLAGALVWGLVGTWRAAKKAPGRLGRKLVLLLLGAQALVVAGALALALLYMLAFLFMGGDGPH